MSGTCRSCGARVIWARTTEGKIMPVDPEPSDRGNVMLEYDPREMRTPVAHYVAMNTREAARAAGWLTYVSHFATCPNASDHRSEKRPAARAKKGES